MGKLAIIILVCVLSACGGSDKDTQDARDAADGPSFCGNGVLEAEETCDLGGENTEEDSFCNSFCKSELCGNASIDLGEACDDGNTASGDGCSPDCLPEICGDGILVPPEECDDGNNIDGDGCESTCLQFDCGNGLLSLLEQCDDGNTDDGDGCSSSCLLESCGDGVIDEVESCDDGNREDGDGCSAGCAVETCGNGIIDPNEGCDDGNRRSSDGCSSRCKNECDPTGSTGAMALGSIVQLPGKVYSVLEVGGAWRPADDCVSGTATCAEVWDDSTVIGFDTPRTADTKPMYTEDCRSSFAEVGRSQELCCGTLN